LKTNILLQEYANHPLLEKLTGIVEKRSSGVTGISGLSGSSKAIISSVTVNKTDGVHFFIHTGREEAAYFYNDMVNLGGKDDVVFLPSSYKRSVQYNQIDNGNVILRTNALKKISDFRGSKKDHLSIVTYPEGLFEKVVTRHKLQKQTLELNKGEQISIDFIREVLDEYHFEQVDFVYEPGQYSVRGGIVDIFSYADDFPYRIDFFGDEVESIRSFEADSQLSKASFDNIAIIPNIQHLSGKDIREPAWRYSESEVFWMLDSSYTIDRINSLYKEVIPKNGEGDEMEVDKNTLFITGNQLKDELEKSTVLEFISGTGTNCDNQVQFNTSVQPAFNKNFSLLNRNLNELIDKGYSISILSDSQSQIDRLRSIFHDTDEHIQFTDVLPTLHEGFIDHDLRLCCYTDHQIFERYHKYRISSYFSSKAAINLKELKSLQPGDYVVHIDHGIGQFGGLVKVHEDDKEQEVIRLVYKDNDIVHVSIHSLHRISKYKSKDESPPKIHKLGSGAWQKLKLNTKKKVKDIAKDLITLYARRKSQKGFQFSQDTYLQNELEASFIFEDTPDQNTATKKVKTDMESDTPMDRLVCGDVGFGKTEVAIRAAFKAVADNKQVAVLVPTTILALQHFNTFSERLMDFPCSVDYISRLKPAKKQKETIQKLKEGKLDIIIGTHRLIGKDVVFKDLGLLIIDEEQKFGVSVKEKLKKLKLNVDTLTLTATPIPRTLQFSLMGARDLSIINTPPSNRHPIITELHSFNENIIHEGIEYELSRGGQVFFINNRIQNIYEIETLIKGLFPGASVAVAHGQMEGPKLEKIMLGFIRGDYDVLVATAIIESGVDIPNANTIFINNAHHFGLSDLHQLRGRVGRANRKAFCFMLAPPLTIVTPEARRRLKAIEEMAELGSGFNIALQDLDIRGAGNLLGSEQSGFIADIGYETYNRILDEAIRELRETEFKEQYKRGGTKETTEKDHEFLQDCQIDTDLSLMFPDKYVSNISGRIRLYRELDNITGQEQLNDFENRLIDRFGPLPDPTRELLLIVKLRWEAVRLGFEKIILKNKLFIGYFISDKESIFYTSPAFGNILRFVQIQPRRYRMKEAKNRLTLTVKHIDSVRKALDLLEEMVKFR